MVVMESHSLSQELTVPSERNVDCIGLDRSEALTGDQHGLVHVLVLGRPDG